MMAAVTAAGEECPAHPGLLVCIGDLVEDVVVWTDGPVLPATDNPARIHRSRGGSAANVAVLGRPLGRTRFIGRVGDDALGRALVAELERAGVEPRVQVAGRTGTILVLVDDRGERTMFPDRAAAAELADVPPADVAGAEVVHAPAYAFATPRSAATTTALLLAGRAQGALVSLDASSVDLLTRLGPAWTADWLAGLRPDVLFANAAEARVLGLGGGSDGGPGTGLPGTTVVVKHGADPVRVTGPDGSVTSVPVDPVAAVRDTTGAGDAFAAGWLSARLAGADTRTAVRTGSRLAAAVLARPGATAAPLPPPLPAPPDDRRAT